MAENKSMRNRKLNKEYVKVKSSNRYAYILVPLLLVLGDYIAILCAEKFAALLRAYIFPGEGGLHITWLNFYILTPVLYILIMHVHGLYTRKIQFWRTIGIVFKANFYAVLTGVLLLYVAHVSATTSRLYIGLLALFSFPLIMLFRFILKIVFEKKRILEEPVLLMGAGLTAELLLKHINQDVGLNYRFIGYLEDNEPNAEVASQLSYLGKFTDAIEVIQKTGIKSVMIMAPGLSQQKLQELVYDLQPLVKNISFIPDLGTLPLSNLDFESLVDGHVVMLRVVNNLQNKWNRVFKFVFDWCLTLVGIIIISPILLAIALWIYCDSPGPVIFKHRRIGKDGKEFPCYKFRSMCVDADIKLKELLDNDPEARAEWEKDFKLKNDPRITRSGAFLRKTSLDELPQVFNVIKGEMSLVGPRPIISDEVPRYGKYIEDYYMVRPGMTGIWQTSGRSDVDYNERVQLDSWYVRNWNIWFDIVLIWRTFGVVLHKKGAY